MFIEQSSEIVYNLKEKRKFYDQECPLEGSELEAAKEIAEKAAQLNSYLKMVYQIKKTGGKADAVEKPECLNVVAPAKQRAKRGTAASSSKTSQSKPEQTESSSNTSQASG